MRKIDVSCLEPGMKLGYTIYNSKGDELLKAGVVLNESYIMHLVNGGFSYVWLDDGLPFQYPEVNEVVNQQTRVAASRQVKKILLGSKESGRLVIEPQSLYSTVGELTKQILSNNNLIYNLVDLRMQDDYTFVHSVNVCILALMTGITMGYNKSELAILGVGALLHDLGKMKIPDAILNKPAALTEEEFKIIKKHTVFGHELILEAGNVDEINALMALQHHENYDGSGYPQGLKNEQISEYSQIIAIADRFDAITADRVYRKAYPANEAYEMCEASINYFVKESVARAFMYNIAAYPAGTVVELNNGMVGVTAETPKGNALFPMVQVYLDEKKQRLPRKIDIPLYEESGFYIVKVLDEHAPKNLLAIG